MLLPFHRLFSSQFNAFQAISGFLSFWPCLLGPMLTIERFRSSVLRPDWPGADSSPHAVHLYSNLMCF